MTWKDFFEQHKQEDYFQSLEVFIDTEYRTKTILPPRDKIFTAFTLTPFHNVKVVILGQDPYPTAGQAHGLCFSIKNGAPMAPSLRNIFKEIGLHPPYNSDLSDWAQQGVLLLNCVLTVEQGLRNSHKGKGWERLTDAVIMELNHRNSPTVFMLWGNDAQKKATLITNPAHLILKAAHPSPLSANRGFFGCNHFVITNDFLKSNGEQPIDWISSRSPQ